MNERSDRRQTLLITQSDAALRAGVSLATWRRWEEDPDGVSAKTRSTCEQVLEDESSHSQALAKSAEAFERSWSSCHYLSPRQAYAIASVLDLWADGEIQDWLRAPTEPLHTISPFASFDRRVLFHVHENRAWVESVRERCYAVSDEIERGVLPFDREGAYMDELLVAASLSEAETMMNDMPDLFRQLEPRKDSGSEDDHTSGDDAWGSVSDAFDDRCRWDEWEVPIFRNHPFLPAFIAARHPFTWFDVVPPSGRG
ncbi:hypothetical protein [Cryobacterium sp. TMT3-29-2]|uniref:hypothetical protein n=1 Tax=Cryobacterium sp. TMT3-29-2 TaxID=2555867 RepID=UPI0010745079|nr:hypothetical protein [Cryobacterium sp. TMT3-29-2]TFC85948.1 hypothetical protein E3O67_11495 [Cryobacterium sp. TMT3-29-2]